MQLVPCLGDAKGSIVKLPDSFIFRCLCYEYWKTLKMFLPEFKEKAENVMLFKKKSGNFSEIDEIIRLFLDCGADMKEHTKIGSVELWRM
ncbi:hypothetical protein [Treponema saccharophilum]|uniref:hypothetical protein n=1 Tax=Treponema saccharophilum TaxID=165 RepID=UPI00386494A2